MAEPRYAEIDGVGHVCEDCGAVVFQRDSHTRFHSILSGNARSQTSRRTETLRMVLDAMEPE